MNTTETSDGASLAPRRGPRSGPTPVVLLLALGLALFPETAAPQAGLVVRQVLPPVLRLLRGVGIFCVETIAGYVIGKKIDVALGQDFASQLESTVESLVERISRAAGEERQVLEDQLAQVRAQADLLSRVLKAQAADLDEIRAQQRALDSRLAALESRTAQLERRVGSLEKRVDRLGQDVAELDARLTVVEEALIGECLDRRASRALGIDAYRISDEDDDLIEDRDGSSPHRTLTARLILDTCSPDLRRRGLLIQLALVTRRSAGPLRLVTTFKGIDPLGRMHNLSQKDFSLRGTGSGLDGRVSEIFVPYSQIQLPDDGRRFALALVLIEDGGVIYSLADRVLTCETGRRTDCRFVH